MGQVILLKARDEVERISRIQIAQHNTLRFGFIQAARNFTMPHVLKEVGLQAVRGNVEYGLRVADGFVDQFSNGLSQIFINAAGRESDLWTGKLRQTTKAGETFDVTDPAIIKILQRNKLNMVQNLTAQQRTTIRNQLIAGIRKGEDAAKLARRFRNILGLTNGQIAQVEKYQAALEAGKSDALSVRLRPVNFDAQVERAIDQNDVLSTSQIERMVGAYTNNLRASRAEVIAQTESLKMVNQARNAAFRQVVGKAGLQISAGRKRWLHTSSADPRETHLSIVGTELPMDEPFELPSGVRMMYPGDSSMGAGPDDLIHCKCGIEYTMENT